jgi:hypothetical protein
MSCHINQIGQGRIDLASGFGAPFFARLRDCQFLHCQFAHSIASFWFTVF